MATIRRPGHTQKLLRLVIYAGILVFLVILLTSWSGRQYTLYARETGIPDSSNTRSAPRMTRYTDSAGKMTCVRTVEKGVVHVIITSSREVIDPLMALAASIVINSRSDVMFHFVTLPSYATELRERIDTGALRNITCEIIQMPEERLTDLVNKRLSRSQLRHPLNYARYYLPDLLPCLGRVIYMDADCIVLGDITELYNVKLRENDVIAALDENLFHSNAILVDVLNEHDEHIATLGIPRETHMFNSGVLVADLRRWERQNITAQLTYWSRLEASRDSGSLVRSDEGAGSQVPMNLVLYDRYTPLPPEWNAMTTFGPGRALKVKKLIHWGGMSKPWLSGSKPSPLSKVWREYLSLSTSSRLIVGAKRSIDEFGERNN